jgi:hypothetical protein
MQRTENLSVEDIKAGSSLVSGDQLSAEKTGKIDEDQAMRAMVSKLAK